MISSRRQFLQIASGATAGAALGASLHAAAVPTLGMIFRPLITRFLQRRRSSILLASDSWRKALACRK